MCETLAGLKQACSAFAARFDAALVPPAQLAQVLADAGTIEKIFANIAALSAARMAGGAGGSVARSGHWPGARLWDLAQRSGQSARSCQTDRFTARSGSSRPLWRAVTPAGWPCSWCGGQQAVRSTSVARACPQRFDARARRGVPPRPLDRPGSRSPPPGGP